MKELNEKVGSVEYDDLINAGTPELDVCSVTVAGLEAETVLKRGTVLAVKDGKAAVLAEGNGDASYIVADDTTVGATDTNVVAYRAGHFNRNKLIVAEGYALTSADEDALRQRGILLDTALNA